MGLPRTTAAVGTLPCVEATTSVFPETLGLGSVSGIEITSRPFSILAVTVLASIDRESWLALLRCQSVLRFCDKPFYDFACAFQVNGDAHKNAVFVVHCPKSSVWFDMHIR